MIWHVEFDDFDAYLKSEGFVRVAQTKDQYLYERRRKRGIERVIVRRSSNLTQAEIDVLCDAADLKPPPFHSSFGQ